MDKNDLEQLSNLIDKKFAELENELKKSFGEQNKKLDLHDKKLNLLDKKFDFFTISYQENLDQHTKYNSNLSKINSKLFDHDMRIGSLEARSITTII